MFTEDELANYTQISLKECLMGILSRYGEFHTTPKIEQLPLLNGPPGPGPEMRVSTAKYFPVNNVETRSGNIIATLFWKRYYNEYALLSLVDRYDVHRMLLRKLLTKFAALPQWQYINVLYQDMVPVLVRANNSFDLWYTTQEEIKYWTVEIICKFKKLLERYKDALYHLVQDINSRVPEEYTPLSWNYVQSYMPDAEATLKDPEAFWWKIDEVYSGLLEAHRRLEYL